MDSRSKRFPIPFPGFSRTIPEILAAFGYLFLFAGVIFFSRFLLTRLGVEIFVYALMGLSLGSIYALVSFKNLAIPFYILILSVGAFRFIWAIKAPILPDLYFDRISMIWMSIVFVIMYFVRGLELKRPWKLDVIILLHGSYILLRILMGDIIHFHTWTMSVLMPYLVFFYAKNTMHSKKQIRTLMWFLLVLCIYYIITSLAEKYAINWLLYPRYMADFRAEFVGRSKGPFGNPGIFGNAIGFLLPVHLYFIATARRNLWKVLFGISFVLGFAALFFTYTRGSWIAGIACMATVALFNRGQYLKTLVPLVVIVPFFSLYFLGLGQDKLMRDRVGNDDTVGSRIGVMVTDIRVWRDYPILGCGSFQFKDYRDNYIEPVEVPVLGTIRFDQFRNSPAHDMYFGPLAEDGLIGTVLQFTIYFLVIKALFRKHRLRKKGDHVAELIIPIFAGIIAGYLVGGLTISYRHGTIMGALFYMSAGIAYGYEPEPEDDHKVQADLS